MYGLTSVTSVTRGGMGGARGGGGGACCIDCKSQTCAGPSQVALAGQPINNDTSFHFIQRRRRCAFHWQHCQLANQLFSLTTHRPGHYFFPISFATFMNECRKKLSNSHLTWQSWINEKNHLILIQFVDKTNWPRRDLNTQPSDLESDALPLRHEVLCTP